MTTVACTTFGADAFGDLATLFHVPGYPGYKPEVREAPNGDGRVDTGKRYLHVAMKYDPPAWARAYLALAHHMACEIAERIGVPDAFYPRIADGTLRVLEYPSAGHTWGTPDALGGSVCTACGRDDDRIDCAPVDVRTCPTLAAGAGTAEHTDPDLFTVNLWRSTPEDHHAFVENDGENPALAVGGEWVSGTPAWHLGEIGELVGLGRAVPHRVPARPYTQKALVYFAIPSHGARLPHAGATVGDWLAERIKRSRYT